MNSGTSPAESAGKLFAEGYNCAQSVFAACSGELGIERDVALKLAAPLGGGVGRMRGYCGAFLACALLAGLKFADSSPSRASKERVYRITRAAAEEFKRKNSSLVCAELLKLGPGESSPGPSARTPAFYASRPCLAIVESAAEIARNLVLDSPSPPSKKT